MADDATVRDLCRRLGAVVSHSLAGCTGEAQHSNSSASKFLRSQKQKQLLPSCSVVCAYQPVTGYTSMVGDGKWAITCPACDSTFRWSCTVRFNREEIRCAWCTSLVFWKVGSAFGGVHLITVCRPTIHDDVVHTSRSARERERERERDVETVSEREKDRCFHLLYLSSRGWCGPRRTSFRNFSQGPHC